MNQLLILCEECVRSERTLNKTNETKRLNHQTLEIFSHTSIKFSFFAYFELIDESANRVSTQEKIFAQVSQTSQTKEKKT